MQFPLDFSPKLFSRVGVRTLVLHQTHSSMFLMTCFVSFVPSCWNKKGHPQTGSMNLFKMSWCAEAQRVPLTGTKGARPTPQPHLHQTGHNAVSTVLHPLDGYGNINILISQSTNNCFPKGQAPSHPNDETDLVNI